SGPRDALLADSVAPFERGRAFGLNRSMDHLGAAIGPLLASGMLALGASLRGTFAAASLFGLLRDPRTSSAPGAPPPVTAAIVRTGTPGTLRPGFAPYLVVCVMFALGNSSD